MCPEHEVFVREEAAHLEVVQGDPQASGRLPQFHILDDDNTFLHAHTFCHLTRRGPRLGAREWQARACHFDD